MDTLQKQYEGLLSQQVFDESGPDYTPFDTLHRPMLSRLAGVSGSVITVFDLYLRKHIFTSKRFFDLFGHDIGMDETERKIHADDMPLLLQSAILAISYAFSDRENIRNYKFVADYRICNASGHCVRVMEQQSVLEQDKRGNAWLILSVLDLSPDQNPSRPVKCGIYIRQDNRFLSLRTLSEKGNGRLSPREIEILQMIKDGRLSKEISDRLCISVHTVNTHRQRILEKLDADNSMEAVKYASLWGII
jgi:DNA-binding CsgD family transcriptional regulator